MQTAIDEFDAAIARARDLHNLHNSMEKMLTNAVDLSDILRSEVVLAVSAFDFFVHELTRLGMLECHSQTRPRTAAFNRFQIPLQSALAVSINVLDTEIRSRHGYVSFQSPDKVADAIRLFSPIELWKEVGAELGADPKDIKADLSLIIDRRNKIAHEADLDPSFPGQRWPIDRPQVEHALGLLEKLAHAVFKVSS